MDWSGQVMLGWLVHEQLSLHPSRNTQHSPHFQCSPWKTDWQLNLSTGTVPGSDPPWDGCAGCPQGCGTARHRALRCLSVEGLLLLGVMLGCAGQPRTGAVCSGRTPVLHTLQLCSHMKIPARSGGCSSLEPGFVPARANGSSLGSPGREAVRKGAF